ncbi:MAG: response regulator [Myxococcales bacterium]|nr:response regulator [Myxococcales bacterium]
MKAVLVVDDSQTMRTSVAWTLRGTDVDLMFASSPDDARHCLHQRRPDMILIDVGLEPEDGLTFCLSVKSSPEWATIPVILMPSALQSFKKAQGDAVGADGYILKPFDTQSLLDIVSTHLSIAQPSVKGPMTYAGQLARRRAAAEHEDPETPTLTYPEDSVSGSTDKAEDYENSPNHKYAPAFSTLDSHKVDEIPVNPHRSSPPVSTTSQLGERMASSIAHSASETLSNRVPVEGHPMPSETEIRAMAKDIIENIAWEVVPDLAETIIREELSRLLNKNK